MKRSAPSTSLQMTIPLVGARRRRRVTFRQLNFEGAEMRTTLNIDDKALEQAMKAASGKTKTQVINEALREFARRRKVRGLLEFRGKAEWTGDFDKLRKRRPATR